MFRLELAERLGMTLGMLDATMGANELTRWIAKAQVDNAIAKRQERYPQLAFPQVLDQLLADHRSAMNRKRKS